MAILPMPDPREQAVILPETQASVARAREAQREERVNLLEGAMLLGDERLFHRLFHKFLIDDPQVILRFNGRFHQRLLLRAQSSAARH